MKIKHYSCFNNSGKQLDWAALRNDNAEPSYFLPFTVNEYLLKIGATPLSQTAKIIIEAFNEIGYKKMFSVGSGIASIEYQIKQNSDLFIAVSDYNTSVLRLKKFEIFDEAIILDIFLDPLPFDKSFVILLPRIDTEFDDQQLRFLFEKFHLKGIRYIFFIPANLLSFKTIIAEFKILIYSIVKKKFRIFCGYSRSKSSFIKLWNPYYKIENEYCTDKKFFLLKSI